MASKALLTILAEATLLAACAPGAKATSCTAEPDDEDAAQAAQVSMLQRSVGNASLEPGWAAREREAFEWLIATSKAPPSPGLASWLQSRAEAQSRTQTDLGSLLIGILVGLGLAFFLLLIHNNFNWAQTTADAKELFDDGKEWAEEQRKAYVADRDTGKVCC
ncbi:unnamed protein product [Prorocentrum cordatum]|uniref:Uncharacterized protein n=1 Tax=Prorocentrum cordatum TaxID=2364126 RepID=A0ABN9TSA6_9DINO|nr:unnamed protein product [Polarella glacialis]